MSLICIHPETREEPAEIINGNPATCYVCGDEFDLDDDPHSEVETPLGTFKICGSHWISERPEQIRPFLMCACGEDELTLLRKRASGGWETAISVVAYEGKLWSAECAKNHLLRQLADCHPKFLTTDKLTELRDKARRLESKG